LSSIWSPKQRATLDQFQVGHHGIVAAPQHIPVMVLTPRSTRLPEAARYGVDIVGPSPTW
jgi:hypothetical protein